MIFDADEYAEALTPPSVKIKGRVYTGRVLSIAEWAPLQPRAARAMRDEAGLREMHELCLDYCRLAFPDPWWRLFWGKTTARKIVELPPNVMMKALASFFAFQGAALALSPPVGSEESAAQPVTS